MKGWVVVLGASGGIGTAAVDALLAADHGVIAVARDGGRLAELGARHPGARLVLLPGDLADEAGGAAVARAVRQLRRALVAVIDALAGPLEGGRLLDRDADQVSRSLQQHLVPHVVAARHLLPLLAASGRNGLHLLLGSAAIRAVWAGYGALSVAGAATRALLDVLRHEAFGLGVRIQMLMVATPVRTARNRRCACPEWIDAEAVGARIAQLVTQADGVDPVLTLEPAPPALPAGETARPLSP